MILDGIAPNKAIISSDIVHPSAIFAFKDWEIIASVEHKALLYKQFGKSSSHSYREASSLLLSRPIAALYTQEQFGKRKTNC
jgi:hypothetical protein